MTDQHHPPALLGPHLYELVGGPHDGETGHMHTYGHTITLGPVVTAVYRDTGQRRDGRPIYEHVPDHPDQHRYDSLFP